MIWAALRGLQLPHIEVLCLSPRFQPQICIIRFTTLEQQGRVKGPRTTGAAAAELAAGSHRWYRLALDHAQPGSSKHFLLSYVSMALAHKVTSTFYLDFASRNWMSYEACSPIQNCELTQNITRLFVCGFVVLLINHTVLRCEL